MHKLRNLKLKAQRLQSFAEFSQRRAKELQPLWRASLPDPGLGLGGVGVGSLRSRDVGRSKYWMNPGLQGLGLRVQCLGFNVWGLRV